MAVVYPKGLVIIPKAVQMMTGLVPGRRVTVHAEGSRAIVELEDEAAKRWHEEFRRMRADLTASGEETERSLRKIEKARKERMMHVP